MTPIFLAHAFLQLPPAAAFCRHLVAKIRQRRTFLPPYMNSCEIDINGHWMGVGKISVKNHRLWKSKCRRKYHRVTCIVKTMAAGGSISKGESSRRNVADTGVAETSRRNMAKGAIAAAWKNRRGNDDALIHSISGCISKLAW